MHLKALGAIDEVKRLCSYEAMKGYIIALSF